MLVFPIPELFKKCVKQIPVTSLGPLIPDGVKEQLVRIFLEWMFSKVISMALLGAAPYFIPMEVYGPQGIVYHHGLILEPLSLKNQFHIVFSVIFTMS